MNNIFKKIGETVVSGKTAVATLAGAAVLAFGVSEAKTAPYVQSLFDHDFLVCSQMAKQKLEGKSDAVYLGYFYGCMAFKGHDVASL